MEKCDRCGKETDYIVECHKVNINTGEETDSEYLCKECADKYYP